VAKYNTSTLVWECGNDLQGTGAGGTGTVTSIATGAGLSGGPITTTGTISLAATQLLPTTACAFSQIPKWNGTQWVCTADATVTNAWTQGGNAFGTIGILSVTDGQTLRVETNGDNLLMSAGAGGGGYRVQDVVVASVSSPNVIAGARFNTVNLGVKGATIAGGGSANLGLGGQLDRNTVDADFGTVGGGFKNTASGIASIVAGGNVNTASATTSTVSGGVFNEASGPSSTVTGGRFNVASGLASAVAGGGH
jgi:hypothetical protein